MDVYLFRHGETILNKIGGHFQGQYDEPITYLNETGQSQAKLTGEKMKEKGIIFDHVISSPQVRAVQTAALISGFDKEAMVLDDRLKEMNFGKFDGKDWKEMEPSLFYAMMHDGENYFPGPGAETIFAMVQRISVFLEELKNKVKNGDYPGENILLSTHGGVLRSALVCFHKARIRDFWTSPEVENCAYLKFSYNEKYNCWTLHEGPKTFL